MSSSNQVRLATIKETVYGETPVAGNFKQLRFTSESLSGTPDTAESALIRTDRLSSGQVVVGQSVGGAVNVELAKDSALEELMESAMFNSWVVSAPVVVDLEVNTVAKEIIRSAGDWNLNVKVGDLVSLSGFVASGNNTQVMVASISSATVIKYIGPETLTDEVGSGTSFKVADYLTIGTKNSRVPLSIEKAFLDLTTKAINYRGALVNTMSLNMAYGSIATGTFEFVANNQEPAVIAADFMTDGRTIDPAATSNPLNGSVDMPFIASSSAGTFDNTNFCIQNVELSLNNNLAPQNCIGEITPKDYSEGTANVGVNLSSYLADENWNLLATKLSQTPFQLGFMIKNNDGYYGFYIPALQVSFDDPSSPGQNQDVVLGMSGVGKVAADGGSSLRIYRS